MYLHVLFFRYAPGVGHSHVLGAPLLPRHPGRGVLIQIIIIVRKEGKVSISFSPVLSPQRIKEVVV